MGGRAALGEVQHAVGEGLVRTCRHGDRLELQMELPRAYLFGGHIAEHACGQLEAGVEDGIAELGEPHALSSVRAVAAAPTDA